MPGNKSDLRLGFDQLLTTLAQGVMNPVYVGMNLVKKTSVKRETDYFPVYGNEHFRKIPDEQYVRAMGAKAFEVDQEIPATKQYVCTRRALQGVVDDAEIEQSHPLLKLLEEGVEQLQETHELNKEIRISETLQDSANYDGNVDTIGVTKWDNDTAVDEKINIYKENIADAIGRMPNVLLIGIDAYLTCFQNNNSLSNKLGANERKSLYEAHLKDLLGFEKVIIGRGNYLDTDGTQKKLWGPNLIMGYVNPANGKKQPTFARLFQQSNYPRVTRWRDQPHFNRYEIEDVYGCMITGPSAGFLVEDVV